MTTTAASAGAIDLGGLARSLECVDALVFSGGVGEHSALVVCVSASACRCSAFPRWLALPTATQ